MHVLFLASFSLSKATGRRALLGNATIPIPFTFEGASPLLCISSPQGRKKLEIAEPRFLLCSGKAGRRLRFSFMPTTLNTGRLRKGKSGSFGHRRSRLPEQESPIFNSDFTFVVLDLNKILGRKARSPAPQSGLRLSFLLSLDRLRLAHQNHRNRDLFHKKPEAGHPLPSTLQPPSLEPDTQSFSSFLLICLIVKLKCV